MSINLKHPTKEQNILIILIMGLGVIGFIPILNSEAHQPGADLTQDLLAQETILENKLAIIQENSLLSLSDPSAPEPRVIQKINVIITAYSSSPWETDSNPYITAAGTRVREGIVANNYLPIGTKIKIPELYGDKIFVVEDRMNWKKGYYHVDIWFPSYWEAKQFGAKKTYIEILED